MNNITKSDISLICRCLYKGYTGSIIRYIKRNEIEEADDIKDLINKSTRLFLKDHLNDNKECIVILNSTIKNILTWYKIKTEFKNG